MHPAIPHAVLEHMHPATRSGGTYASGYSAVVNTCIQLLRSGQHMHPATPQWWNICIQLLRSGGTHASSYSAVVEHMQPATPQCWNTYIQLLRSVGTHTSSYSAVLEIGCIFPLGSLIKLNYQHDNCICSCHRQIRLRLNQ